MCFVHQAAPAPECWPSNLRDCFLGLHWDGDQRVLLSAPPCAPTPSLPCSPIHHRLLPHLVSLSPAPSLPEVGAGRARGHGVWPKPWGEGGWGCPEGRRTWIPEDLEPLEATPVRRCHDASLPRARSLLHLSPSLPLCSGSLTCLRSCVAATALDPAYDLLNFTSVWSSPVAHMNYVSGPALPRAWTHVNSGLQLQLHLGLFSSQCIWSSEEQLAFYFIEGWRAGLLRNTNSISLFPRKQFLLLKKGHEAALHLTDPRRVFFAANEEEGEKAGQRSPGQDGEGCGGTDLGRVWKEHSQQAGDWAEGLP